MPKYRSSSSKIFSMRDIYKAFKTYKESNNKKADWNGFKTTYLYKSLSKK